MDVRISTPEKIVHEGQSSDLLVQAERGQLNILERHADLVTFVKPGMIELKTAEGDLKFEVSDGILKVENNQVAILCPTVSRI